MTTYLLHCTILLSAISAIYWLALRHETFFKLNRWTIMLSVFLSLSLPLISIPAEYAVWRSNDAPVSTIAEKIVPPQDAALDESTLLSNNEASQLDNYPQNNSAPINGIGNESAELTNAGTNQMFSMASLGKILTIIYFIGVGVFTMVFLMQLIVLLTSRANLNSFKTGRYNIVEMVKDKEPFSFLNSIYINPASYDEDTYNHIIEHEKIHIDQSHFIDKIIAEILVIIFWFNPFTWLLRSGISRNLEYLTDHSLLNKGVQKSSYQMSLLKVSVSKQPFNLTMSYNSSFLKNRIDMMNTKKSSIVSSWKYLFVPPLFMLSVFSLNAIDGGSATKEVQVQEITEKPVEVEKKDKAKVVSDKKNYGQNMIVDAPQNPKLKPQQNWESKSDGIDSKPSKTQKEWKSSKEQKDWGDESKVAKNTEVISRTLNLENFKSIGLAVNGDVELKYGNKQSVKVEGPAHLIDELNTEVKNGDWNIKFDDHRKHGKSAKLKFNITMTDLTNVAISGNGNIRTVNRFKGLDHLMMAISGNGNMEIDAISNSVFYAISGNGNGELSGKTDKLTIRSSGNGEVDAKNLESKDCDIIISGSGDVSVDVDNMISAKISGSANVYYKGNPKISKQISGSGKVKRI